MEAKGVDLAMKSEIADGIKFLGSPLAKLVSSLGIELDYVDASEQVVSISSEVACACSPR
jgi:hypothetical protein